jgi:hypothetical protein
LDTGQARVNHYHRPERLLRPPEEEPDDEDHPTGSDPDPPQSDVA